jgi:hypothetical protein
MPVEDLGPLALSPQEIETIERDVRFDAANHGPISTSGGSVRDYESGEGRGSARPRSRADQAFTMPSSLAFARRSPPCPRIGRRSTTDACRATSLQSMSVRMGQVARDSEWSPQRRSNPLSASTHVRAAARHLVERDTTVPCPAGAQDPALR